MTTADRGETTTPELASGRPDPGAAWRVRELIRLHDELDAAGAGADPPPLSVRVRGIVWPLVAAYLSITTVYVAQGTNLDWLIVVAVVAAWLIYGGTRVAERRRIAEVKRRIAELEDGADDD
jgi:hypothetical protein